MTANRWCVCPKTYKKQNDELLIVKNDNKAEYLCIQEVIHHQTPRGWLAADGKTLLK
jgi:hypothetical protein